MKINDLDFFLVEIGRSGAQPPGCSVLARLTTDAGLEGWGESRAAWRPDELSARRDALLPLLAGRSVYDIEELLALRALRDAPLRCALEMASWDLVGRAAGQPLCHLFGGDYRRQIPLAVRLDSGSPQRVAQAAWELAAQGCHWQVLTARGQAEHDLQLVRAVRERVGDRVQLRLDCGAQYTPEAARDLCRELEPEGLEFLVDPLRGNSLNQLGALARQTSVPLAAWRSISSPTDVLAVLRCAAVPFVVVDLERVGGMAPARRCAAVAHAGGLGAVLGGRPSLGIAVAAMLHLAASTPAFATCNECSYHQLHDDVLAEPLEIAHGMMAVPQGPGLGVEVDRGRLMS